MCSEKSPKFWWGVRKLWPTNASGFEYQAFYN